MIYPSLRRTALAAAVIASLSSRAAAQSDAAFAAALGIAPGLETISRLKAQPHRPVLAAATAAAPSQIPVIRTNTGLRYELPAGWEWGGFSGNSVTIQHLATKVGGASPNIFEIGVTPTYGNDYAMSWDRIDRDQQRTYPGGVAARWRAGLRFGLHYAFVGEATIGSKALSVTILTRRTPLLDVNLVEAAFMRIVETLQDVPASATLYHPSLGFAAEPLPAKSWYPEFTSANIRFRCWKNGRSGDALIQAVPASAAYADARKALADLTAYFEVNNSLKIGAAQSALIPGGEVLWTEQPGSQFPYIGAILRDGRYYHMTLFSNGPGSCTQEPSLADFLAVAKSLRAWDGK